MRAIRRLPPLLRALVVFALLACPVAIGVLTWTFRVMPGDDQVLKYKGFTLSLSLVMLAMACNVMIVAYNMRFERPGRSAPWPDSWQAQLTIVLALATLPLCSLVFALLVPPSPSMYDLVLALQILSILVLVTAWIWVFVRYYG
jgi:hypothetical protein